MEKIYRVSYILSGITERTDDFANMADNSTESAIKAIREKFNGTWGFNPDAIEVKEIICGHYECKPHPQIPFINLKTWVVD